MFIIKIILKILLTILIILALALCVPTRFYVRYTNEVFIQIRYLFIKFTIPITESQKAKTKNKKISAKKKVNVEKSKPKSENQKTNSNNKKQKRKDKNKNKKPNPVVKWLKSLYNKGGVEAITEAFKKIASLVSNVLKPIFRSVRFRNIDINIIVASDNAADTAINYGRLCAGVYPALGIILNVIKYNQYSVNIKPDFNKEKIELDISTEISLIPWVVIFGAVHALVRFIKFKAKGEL